MMNPHDKTEALEAARRCLEAYGGDLDRWPDDLRARYGELAVNAVLEKERAEAGALDALLDEATAPTTPHDLKNRIEAGYNPPTNKTGELGRGAGLSALAAWLRPLPAGAFAGMAVLGFAAAAVTDNESALAPEYEAYVYLQDSGLAAFDEEAGTQWVVD